MKKISEKVSKKNLHLFLLAIPFAILPTKTQIRDLVEVLASRQQDPAVQWAAIIFFASIPLFIMAPPCYELIKLQLEEDRSDKEKKWSGVIAVLFLLVTTAYTIIRVLYWVA